MLKKLILLMMVVGLLSNAAVAEDWTRFRGANGDGTSSSKNLPAEIGPGKNQVWAVDVPFGRSSPIIVGDRIYLTATDDGQFVTIALDRKSGKQLWRKAAKPARKDDYHHDTDSATTTPVSDGENLYLFFQELGLLSYDKDGKQRWSQSMGPFRNFYSIAASPVVGAKYVYMLCDQVEGSFLVAYDKATGKEAWRRNRPGRMESYTTPIFYPNEKKPTALVVFGSGWVDAYNPADGKTLWSIGELPVGPVPSPILIDKTLYVVGQNHASNGWPPYEGIVKEHDKNDDGELSREEVAEAWLAEHYGWLNHDGEGNITEKDWVDLGNAITSDHWGVYAIRLDDDGKKAERLWNYRKNIPEIASPLVYNDVMYIVEKGVLTTIDTKSGEMIKRDRLGGGAAKVYASPVGADGKVFIGTLDGTLYTLSGVGEWETLASVDLDEEIWATPAIADGHLFVRTRGKLYDFAAAKK